MACKYSTEKSSLYAAYRFGNAIVDDWEGKVNAWPLDEGLIDYVDVGIYGEASDENPLHSANVIASETIVIGAETIDASTIDTALISEQLHEVGAIEANVATGYHAIEFLLWGQDLNGTWSGRRRAALDGLCDGRACTDGIAIAAPPISRPRAICWSTISPGWPTNGRGR